MSPFPVCCGGLLPVAQFSSIVRGCCLSDVDIEAFVADAVCYCLYVCLFSSRYNFFCSSGINTHTKTHVVTRKKEEKKMKAHEIEGEKSK